MQTSPNTPIKQPSMFLTLTEGHRVFGEVAALGAVRPLLSLLPRGDGHAVLVLPGFMGSDRFSTPLIRFLNQLGYQSSGWGMGRNLGPRGDLLDRMTELVCNKADNSGSKVTLIGHSLGGIYARELAKRVPESVRQVISLGSPFGRGRETGSRPHKWFYHLNPERRVEENHLAEAPPVPTTAVFTKGDGIVNWRTCFQDSDSNQQQNIQVRGSHVGLIVNPSVWFVIADRLAQRQDQWQPFKKASWPSLFYPRPH